MPNSVKYKTGNLTGSISTGNVALGVNESVLGPTETTGWYAGIDPEYGKYTVYKVNVSSPPNIFYPGNDDEIIRLAKQLGASGGDVASTTAALAWMSSQSDLIVNNFEYEAIITNGLVLSLDSGFITSYPATGTAIQDLSGNGNNCVLTNGISFSSNGSDYDGSGALIFDGADDYIDFYAPGLGTTTTVEMWCKIGAGYSGKMFMGWGTYDVYCNGGTIGYNTGNSDVYGISQATVNSLGIVNQWAHYVFEFRTDVSYTNNKIYINGVSQTLSQQLGSEGGRSFNGGSGRVAGWRAHVGYQMPMSLGIFRVYNRALTQSEVTQNYNAQKGRYQNFYTNGNFQFLTTGGALQNFVRGTVNTTTVLPGNNYSLQIPQQQYTTFLSNNLIEVDTTKTYRMTVKNRTLTKGGPGNNILSGGHTGYITYDSSFRFIDLRNCGGVANTYLTRNLVAGDAYAYVSNQNNQWYAAGSIYYFRHFCLYPPSHPEYNKPWEYTRIGYGDYNIFYNEITDIGGGELRMRFTDSADNWVTFPNIGYPTPAGTPVMNGVAGGTFSYVFYPTTAAYGEWTTHTSGKFTGENRNSGTPFRYATKYVSFMHLINYAVPSGTSPLPIMLFGDVKLEQVK
jgi:hypothetical protein